MVSDMPFSAASFGKNGANIDIEQKLMKSTNAKDSSVSFWRLLKLRMADDSKRAFVL